MFQSYPFDQLPKLKRRELTVLRRCVRQLPRVDLDLAQATARKLLGTAIELKPGVFEWCNRGALSDRLTGSIVALVLERGAGGFDNRLLIDLSPHLAAVIVDRALGGQGEQAIGKGIFPLDDLSRGVFAYAAARLLHAAGSRFLLSDVLVESKVVGERLGEQGAAVRPVEVRIGVHLGRARVWIPYATAGVLTGNEALRYPDALAQLKLSLVAIAGGVRLDFSEVCALKPADVVLLDECDLYRRGLDWLGSVKLMIDGARRSVWRCKAENQALIIESVNTSEEQKMAKGETQTVGNPQRLMKLAGDAPIEISVELARFSLTLEEIGALQAGEILATGCPIGERATLRAGGRAIASGELVDIEGDIGVRILSVAQ
ncbi:MAG: FliM/FliN family flagellar motor switch protein [Deltaproteobacteria bacterium]|nr:FliM/FliN family flagellar motor switch protein [Deltaproteobacteria bacterium]